MSGAYVLNKCYLSQENDTYTLESKSEKQGALISLGGDKQKDLLYS